MQKRFLFVLLTLSFGVLPKENDAQASLESPSKKEREEKSLFEYLETLFGLRSAHVKADDDKSPLKNAWQPGSTEEAVRWLCEGIPAEIDKSAAQQYLRRSIEEQNSQSDTTVTYYLALGALLFDAQAFDSAYSYFSEAYRILEGKYGYNSEPATNAQLCLVWTCYIQSEFDEALFHWSQICRRPLTDLMVRKPCLKLIAEGMFALNKQRRSLEGLCGSGVMLIEHSERTGIIDTLRFWQWVAYAASAYVDLARFREADELIARAEPLFLEQNKHYANEQVVILLAMSRMRAYEENHTEAMLLALRADTLSQHQNVNAALRGEVILMCAELFFEQGAPHRAKWYLQQFYQVREQAVQQDPYLSIRATALEMKILSLDDKWDEAEALCKGLLSASVQGIPPAYVELAPIHEQLGMLYLQKGSISMAEEELSKAIRLYRVFFSESHPRVVKVGIQLSLVQFEKGDFESASRQLKNILEVLSTYTKPLYLTGLLRIAVLEAMGRLQLKYYYNTAAEEKLYSAWIAIKDADKEVSALRLLVCSNTQWLSLQQHYEKIAELGIAIAYEEYSCCHDKKWLDEAYAMCQTSKDFLQTPYIMVQQAFSRLQPFQNLFLTNLLTGPNIGQLKRMYSISSTNTIKYQKYLKKLPEVYDTEQLLDLLNQNERNDKNYYELLEKQRKFIQNNQLPLPVYTPSSSQIFIAQLRKKEVILDFFLGEYNLYIFILSKKSQIELISIPTDEQILEDIEAMTSAMRQRKEEMNYFYNPAYRLYERIFKPIELHFTGTDVEEICIIPHGNLAYLPFSALLVSPPKARKAARPNTYDFLLYKYVFYYAHSTNHWKISRDKSYPKRPHEGNYVILNREIGLRSGMREAQKVSSAIGINRFMENFSKTDLLDTLRKGNIVHIISHASASEEAALCWKGAKDSSSCLYLFDILSLNLKASIIGLSACETAMPSFYHPYGISLAEAFSHAGAACVIGTLWPIEDEGSARIMASFYEALSKRRINSKASALRDAQIEMLKEKGHPYYWAGVRVYGNSLPFERPEQRMLKQAARQMKRAKASNLQTNHTN